MRPKLSSVRWDENAATGQANFYSEDDERPALRGQISAVNRFQLNDLTVERLGLAPGETVEGYILGLRQHYPHMPADASVDVVDFHLDLGLSPQTVPKTTSRHVVFEVTRSL